MKYVIGILLGLFIGCSVSYPQNPTTLPKVIVGDSVQKDTARLPKEVEAQFDAYLASKVASGFLDSYIIELVKRIIQGIFLSIVISILFDFPLQSALVIILPIFLVSYPVARWVVKNHATRIQTSS